MENQRARENQGTAYSYRNLDVWNRAQELALGVIKVTESLPSTAAAYVIARQIVRCAASVGANIAEGHGRYSLAAYRNHLSIAKGSASETDSWLDLLRRAGYIDEATEAVLHGQCITVIGALTRRMRDIESRLEQAKTRGVREDEAEYNAGSVFAEDGDV
jgi:four helix bundle protein